MDGHRRLQRYSFARWWLLLTLTVVVLLIGSCDAGILWLTEPSLELNHPPGTYTKPIEVEPKDWDKASYFYTFDPSVSIDQFMRWWNPVQIGRDTVFRAYKIDSNGRRSRIYELSYRFTDTVGVTVPDPELWPGRSERYRYEVFWFGAEDNVLSWEDLDYALYTSTANNITTYEDAERNGSLTVPWTPGYELFGGGDRVLRAEVRSGAPGERQFVQVFVRDLSGAIAGYAPRAFRSTPVLSLSYSAGATDQIAPNYMYPLSELLNESIAGPTAGAVVTASAFGDLNRDSYDDLIVSTSGQTVYDLSTGMWLEDAPTPFATAGLIDIEIREMNNDDRVDVVTVGGGSNVRVWTYDGGFGAPSEIAGSAQATDAAIADVTGDGTRDLILAMATLNQVRIYAFDSGSLTEVAGSPISFTSPSQIATGDLNGDRIGDFVVTSTDAGTPPIVAYGLGGGMVDVTTPGGDWSANGYVDSVAIVELTYDWLPDVILRFSGAPVLHIYRNNGDGTFEVHSTYSASAAFDTLLVADLTTDGEPDLVLATGTTIELAENTGGGSAFFDIRDMRTGYGAPLAAGRIR